MTANAGINVADMDIQHLKTNPKVGYNFNITLEYNLPKKFFLQTGLEFTNKGAKVKDNESGTALGSKLLEINKYLNIDPNKIYYYASRIDGKFNTQYFTIPLMAGYRLPVSEKVRMNLSLGPYFSFGIGGNTKTSQLIVAIVPPNEMEIGDFNGANIRSDFKQKSFDILKRFDMGLKGNVGIEYSRCLLNIGYEYGFIDQFKGDELSSYNMNFFATVGFRIL